jgi:hypothetical protein
MQIGTNAGHRPRLGDKAAFVGNSYCSWPKYEAPSVWLSLHRLDGKKHLTSLSVARPIVVLDFVTPIKTKHTRTNLERETGTEIVSKWVGKENWVCSFYQIPSTRVFVFVIYRTLFQM